MQRLRRPHLAMAALAVKAFLRRRCFTMSDFVPLPPGGGGGGRPRQWSSDRRRNNQRGRGYRGRGHRGRGRFNARGRGRGPRKEHNFNNTVLTELGTKSENSLSVAIEGCCHGELDAIYKSLVAHQERTGQKIDVLLCCGDFQSLRNTSDYHSLAVPPKYRTMGSFWRYYSGELVAPVLTIFVGGNHEASQPLQELYYGGWVAPNIYYLGAAGVVRVGGIRIGGVSGIYKPGDYRLGRFERPPYDRSTLRSVYHVRNTDVFRLKSLSSTGRLDIVVSHDWPQGIEQYGDIKDLLRRKPYFRDEVQKNELGSPPNFELLKALQPSWWFSAHLHVKFVATVPHNVEPSENESSQQPQLMCGFIDQPNPDKNPMVEEKGDNGMNVEDTSSKQTVESSPAPAVAATRMTQFLSLDKCLPGRHFLSVVHIPREEKTENEVELVYDLEWLAMLKKTHHLTVPEKRSVRVPNEFVEVTEEEKNWVRDRLMKQKQEETALTASSNCQSDDCTLSIPQNFTQTVPPHGPSQKNHGAPYGIMGNPQTDALLELLELDHIVTVPYVREKLVGEEGRGDIELKVTDENEVDLSEDDLECTTGTETEKPPTEAADEADCNEIALSDEEEATTMTGEKSQDRDPKRPRMADL